MREGEIIDNRYQVVRPLGSGGMGSVFLVRDLEKRRECALKRLDGVTAGGMHPAIRREFEALATLKHAGVVEVYELGDAYYTMEVVHGKRLGELAGETPWRILDLACELAQILAYIHSCGVIHRDLKPDNIVVCANDRMVVMDFGLALARMRHGEAIAGTVGYMAPEQLKGFAIDPRADIYSVGVILYQLVTRRLPFDEASLMATVLDQIRTPPPPPRRFNRDLPEPFEALILKAMAKDPLERFQTAEDLLESLRALGGRTDIKKERIEKGAKILMEPAFVGRDEELARLAKSFERCAKERTPGIALVEGPRGIGCSRLATEFAGRRLSVDELFLELDLVARHDGPLGALSTLVAAAVRQLERIAPELAGRLGNIFGTLLLSAAPALAQESAQLALLGEARLSTAELRESVLDYLVQVAQTMPVAIVIHGLERAPKPFVDALVELVKLATGTAVWICGVLEHKDGRPAGPWQALLSDANVAKRTEIAPGPLDAETMTRLLASMCGKRTLEAAKVKPLVRVCLGRPGLGVELFRDLAEVGQIYRKGTQWVIEISDLGKIPRPELLEDALFGRLAGLSPAARATAEVLALALGRAEPADCAALAGLSDAHAIKAIAELTDGGFLIARDEGRRAAMPFPRIATQLAQGIEPARRARLHHALAERLAAREGIHPADLRAVADHFHHAGEDTRALEAYLKAGERAKERRDDALALACYQEATGLAERAGARGPWVEALGQLGSLSSRAALYPKAVEHYKQALELVGDDPASARAQVFFRSGLGYALFKLRKLDDAHTMFSRLLKAAPRLPLNYLHLARVELSRNQVDEAEKLLRQGLDVAKDKKDEDRTRAALYHQLGRVHYTKGMFPTASNFYDRAFELLEEKDPHLKGQIASSYAQLHLTRSEPARAYKHVEDALLLAHETGDGSRVASGLVLAGMLHERDGALRKANRLHSEALDLANRGNHHAEAGKAYLALGRAAVAQHEPETANPHLGRASRIFKEIGADWGLGYCYMHLAEAQLLQGFPDKAMHLLGRAEKRFKAAGLRWILPHVYALVTDVYLAQGELDLAVKLLNKTIPKAKSVRDNVAAGGLYRRYALVCEARDKRIEAAEHFVASRTMLAKTRHSIEIAHTDLEYGRFLLAEEKRGEHGFVKTAIKLLTGARAVFEGAFARPLAQRTTLLLEECQRVRIASGIDNIVAGADLGQPLAELQGDTARQLMALRREFERQLDGSMDGKAILERFEQQLKSAETALNKRVSELKGKNRALLGQLEELKSERRNLLTLQEINTQISSTLDSAKLLDLILDTALSLLKAERGFIMLVGEDQEPEFRAARNIDREQIDDPASGLSTTIVRKVIRTKESVLTSDAQADARFDGASIQELKLKSLMCAPLVCKNRAIGALYVDNRSASDLFNEKHLELLISFSNQAALALENALLYEQVRQKERLEQELGIAARIQKSLLPKEQPVLPGLEVCGLMRPAGQLGGDYYDFIERDGSLSVCIGDVSGKGVGASLVMVMARLFLHHWDIDIADTRATICAANRILHANTEPFVFMSMLLLHWDRKRRVLRYTGGGHETLLVYRAAKKEVESIPSGGVVLGIKAEIEDLVEEKSLELAAGDVVLLYTDGATEAHNVAGDLYGLERLKDALARHAKSPAAKIIEAVLADIGEFVGEREQHDDITISVLRRTAN